MRQDVFERPPHPYTTGLLAAVPRVDGTAEPLHPIAGTPPNLIDLPTGCPFAPRCHLATDICRQEHPALVPLRSKAGPAAAACHHA